MKKQAVIYTIGHSTHSAEEFIALLEAYGIKALIDIRTIPRSRHNPQFNKEELARALRRPQVSYTHINDLGGLRKAKKDSPNLGWHNMSFRGFADYMQSEKFDAGCIRAIGIAGRRRAALMCAEALPWRCHRSLVADALTVRGYRVYHIMSLASAPVHTLTPFLVQGRTLTYPAPVPTVPR